MFNCNERLVVELALIQLRERDHFTYEPVRLAQRYRSYGDREVNLEVNTRVLAINQRYHYLLNKMLYEYTSVNV